MGMISKKIFAVLTLSCLLVVLCSCGTVGKIDDYRSRPFRCVIDFSVGERKICADLTVKDIENTQMEILSPDALAGVVIYGNGKVEYGGMSLNTKVFEELISYACALVPKGEMSRKNKVKGRASLLCVTVEDTEMEGKIYEIYVDKKSGYPVEIHFDGKNIYVRDFEFID